MKPTKEQLKAWREARIINYAHTRSPLALARMVVELEDDGELPAEFDIDEDWPEYIRHMKVAS